MAWPKGKKNPGGKKATKASPPMSESSVTTLPDPAVMAKTEPEPPASPEPSSSPTISRRREAIRAKRRERGALTSRLKMELSPGLKEKLDKQELIPRWVADRAGRIEDLISRGYSFVQKDGTCPLANPDIQQQEGLGSVIRMSTGTHEDGSPMYSYLMAQDKEIYEEDQREKLAPQREHAEQLRKGYGKEALNDDGHYGGFKAETTR